jgi:hypothetical protein
VVLCRDIVVPLSTVSSILDSNQINDLRQNTKTMKCNIGIPGGFTTNSHQTDMSIVLEMDVVKHYDDNASVCRTDQLKNGYWTAAINKNSVTPETSTVRLPRWLRVLGRGCRRIATDKYNIASTTHLVIWLFATFTLNLLII